MGLAGDCACCCKKTVTFKATLCCGCDAVSADRPVAITVSQTSGGTFLGTGTITSDTGVTFTLPSNCPSGSTNQYSVSYSCSAISGSSTSTYTPVGTSAQTVTLNVPSTQACFPGADCFEAVPSSITVTVTENDYSPSGACYDPLTKGPWTLSTKTVSDGGCIITYTYNWTYVQPVTLAVFNAKITVAIQATTCGTPTATVSFDMVDGGGNHLCDSTATLTSGTAICPISFTATATQSGSTLLKYSVSQ